jgi:uncharacterized membrane protein YqjE
MDPEDALENETSGQAATYGDPLNDSGVLEDAQSLLRELLGLTHDRFRLAALETRQAGESLVAMIMAGVLIAILLGGAWLGLMAAAVLGLIENGILASSAILLAVVFNLLLALILCGVVRRKSRYLQFPATLRSLQTTSRGRRRDARKS